MVDFQLQNGKPVDGPSGTFRVEGGIGLRFHALEQHQVVTVNHLHEVGAVLVRLVDSTFQGQSLHGVDARVADEVFEMPLHGVDPCFLIEMPFDGLGFEGVMARMVHIVELMVVGDGLVEDADGLFGRDHDGVGSMQFGQGFLDSSGGLDEFVERGGVGEADAVVVAERLAGHAGHMGVVKQPHAKVVAAFDDGLTVGLAVVRLHLGEYVEGTGGGVALHAGDLVHQLHEGVATLTEGFQHVLDLFGVFGAEFHGLGGRGLGDGADA